MNYFNTRRRKMLFKAIQDVNASTLSEEETEQKKKLKL
jgi:hypothetical protein